MAGESNHLPCPFCGSGNGLSARTRAGSGESLVGYVSCAGCGARGPEALLLGDETTSCDLATRVEVARERAWERWDARGEVA